MADKFKDAEDRWLESILNSDAIVDDGFSNRVLVKLRRRVWLRRLILPMAILIGCVVAFKPATQLVGAISNIVRLLPADIIELPQVSFSQMPLVLIGSVILTMAILFFRMLED